MAEDIKQRLQDSSQNCIKSFEAWNGNKKDNAAREALQEAVHEIRKVASRLEIELAVSERDDMASKPIPIPPHRDARGRHQNADDRPEAGNEKDGGQQRRPRSRKPTPKKASGGEG